MKYISAKKILPDKNQYVIIAIKYFPDGGYSDYPMVGFVNEDGDWFTINADGTDTMLPTERDEFFWFPIPNWEGSGE